MSAPAISVIMASYNGAAHVAATVRSILCQSFGDFELIVADDCSTDDTRTVLADIRDPRLRLLAMPRNAGPVAARNMACEAARGNYLAALDQDDLAHPDRFAAQIRYLEANPSCAAVGTATCHLRQGRLVREAAPARTTPDFVRWMLHTGNPLVWSSMMIRRKALAAAGALNRDEFRFAEDFDLYHRLCAAGDVARLDQVLTIYRSHGAGASCRYRGRMMGSAISVLTRAYAPWFGAQAADHAGPIIRHLSGGEAVAGVDRLQAVTDTLRAVHGQFILHHRCGPETQAMIGQQMSCQWWRMARAALRAGTLTPRDVVSRRPDFALKPGFDATDLAWSAAIGTLRAARPLKSLEPDQGMEGLAPGQPQNSF
jgi:hypothetical protein